MATIARRRFWTQALSYVRRMRAIVLGYHGIAESSRREDLSRLQVSPAHFRTQLELLLAAGFRFMTVADLVRAAGGGTPPPGLAAVSFDDGMRNNHHTALPIMSELGIPATVYVTVDFLGGRSPWVGPGGDRQMLTERELCDLVDAGWEVGAHTMTHPDLSTLDYDGCRREIEDSRDALERITGTEVTTFAYPYGRYGAAAVSAARDAGLMAAVTTGSGTWDPFVLTRAMMSAGDPLSVMMLKLTDRYEPLLQPLPLRLARVASKRLRYRIANR